MATAKRQRELERQRQLRQAQRRAEAARRRRRRTLLASGVGVTVAIVAVAIFLAWRGNHRTTATPLDAPTGLPTGTANPAEPTASASPAVERPLACGLAVAPPAPSEQQFPTPPPLTIDKAATYTMAIKTTCGDITARLAAGKAPTAVNSFAFLAGKKFFDNTECHRVTTLPTLTVLQCGDPTGTGSGGPGYSFPDENLTGATYPRGTLAMANSGKDTNGSQFFLVDKDSQLPPSYIPFGTITGGLDVLDKIVAQGVEGGGSDGKPAERVFLTTLTVMKG